MDDKIKQLIEVQRKYNEKIKEISEECCPTVYGLKDHCYGEKLRNIDVESCQVCWEMAIEEIKENAD